MLGGLLPRRFWRSLQPAQPSRPRRLLVYWLAASLLTFAAAAVHAGQSLYVAARDNETIRAMTSFGIRRGLATPSDYLPTLQAQVQQFGGIQGLVDELKPPTRSRRFMLGWYRTYNAAFVVRTAVVFALWPWLTFATLMIFQVSMRRAKVRPVHVLRCTIYCCDAGPWLVPLGLFAYVLLSGRVLPPLGLGMPLGAHGMMLAVLALPLYTTCRLWAAYRFYLRFDHPLATAVASQVIVPLFLFTAAGLLSSL
jgi:hypothetical protein